MKVPIAIAQHSHCILFPCLLFNITIKVWYDKKNGINYLGYKYDMDSIFKTIYCFKGKSYIPIIKYKQLKMTPISYQTTLFEWSYGHTQIHQ